MRHVVWDWNGTLLDDQQLVVASVNAVLALVDAPPITLADYQRHYTRPVHRFYERLLGRDLTPGEWERFDRTYHERYRDLLVDRAQLTGDALDALERVTRAGRTQSLLSMWRHEELVGLVERLGLDRHFTRVDGLRNGYGSRKAAFLVDHLAAIADATGGDAGDVVLIGDAVDDALAAQHVGAACVLYDGGSHSRAELEAAGTAVADSLLGALALAGIG